MSEETCQENSLGSRWRKLGAGVRKPSLLASRSISLGCGRHSEPRLRM